MTSLLFVPANDERKFTFELTGSIRSSGVMIAERVLRAIGGDELVHDLSHPLPRSRCQ